MDEDEAELARMGGHAALCMYWSQSDLMLYRYKQELK